MIKKIFIGLSVLLLALLALILMQPDEFSLSRSLVIASPPQPVFDQVNNFHNWEAWSPWAKLDPDCQVEFAGPESGKGAIFKWSGNNEVGEGSQEIIESRSPELVRIQLTFIRPFAGSNETLFTFQPEGANTRVTWTMTGKQNFVAKCLSLLINCETLLGPTFEEGLANLKHVVESKPQS